MENIALVSSGILLFVMSACIGPEKSKQQIDVANKTFAFEIGIYFDSDSIAKQSLIDKAAEILPEFKYYGKPPDSIQDNGYSITRYNDLTQDYQPPDTSFLSFAGIGLSSEEKLKLSKSDHAIVVTFWGTSENVIGKQRKIVNLISSVVAGKRLFVGDFSALSFFNPDSWKASRQEPFTGSNIIDQVVLHTYREEEFCRVVSLGMSKFCLPDVSIKDISCNDQRTYATLVNALIAALIENSKIKGDSTVTIDLEEIKDDKLRKVTLADIKSGALKKATISLRFVRPEQGDDPNKQLRMVFENPSFSSPQEQQNKVVADLFGTEESYVHTEHDDELLQASQRAKSKLPDLMKAFLKGFGPGYSLLLKLPFKTDSGGREWMWVEVTKWKGDHIEGILQNEPAEVSNLKVGAIVTGSQQDVFDYILNKPDGTTEGNETGKILELRD